MNPQPQPLRVLQVTSLFNGGGTDSQTMELTAGLHTLGDDVTLAVPAGSRWEPRARRLNVPLETFPERSFLKLAAIRSWIRIIRQKRIQIIHAHQGRDYWPSIIAARLAGCGTKVVVTRHMMTRPRRLSRQLLLSCCDVVAVSRAVLGVLQSELKGPATRLHQLYGGIDTSRFQPVRSQASEAFRRERGWGPDQVVLGVVGTCNMPRGKGQWDLLNAAIELHPEFPNLRCLFVGKGTMEPFLRDRIAELGWQNIAFQVPFTDDVTPVLGALDVLVHPAVYTEALGIVLWEAMACGKPVIGSRLHGIPEAFREGEHGFLITPGDTKSLASAMRRLLQNPELRKQFGNAGREWVCQNASREVQARRMRELYRQLLSGGGRTAIQSGQKAE